MPEQAQTQVQTQLKPLNQGNVIRTLDEVLKEVDAAIREDAAKNESPHLTIKDLRWEFDQVSAKMNQAIYNDRQDLIHESCLKTVVVLIKMLARG